MIQPYKRTLAFGCALALTLALSGCSTAKAALKYIDEYVPPTAPPTSATVPGDPADPQVPTTTPAPTEPVQTVLVGVVSYTNVLNIRAGAGVNHDKVGTLTEGTKVAIYEQVPVGDEIWGRIKSGWICMSYIVLQDGSSSGNEPVTVTTLVATVKGDSVNIRTGPGTNYSSAGLLNSGDKIQITEIRVVDEALWCKSVKGWVRMDLVNMEGAAEGEVRITGTTNASKLNIRSAAGANNSLLGSYASGTKVLITQLVEVGGAPWGKTDKGWICVNYVDFDGNLKVSVD